MALQLCLDGLPNCLASRADLIDAHAAGGDGEAFYYEASADAGGVTVANALEARTPPTARTRRSCSCGRRSRIRASGGSRIPSTPSPTRTAPTCTPVGGVIRNNACRTETTIVPLEFNRAAAGRIGPFLTWDTLGQPLGGINPPPPAGYIGDSATPHKVVGSPTNFNMVRIEGPGINKTATETHARPSPAPLPIASRPTSSRSRARCSRDRLRRRRARARSTSATCPPARRSPRPSRTPAPARSR